VINKIRMGNQHVNEIAEEMIKSFMPFTDHGVFASFPHRAQKNAIECAKVCVRKIVAANPNSSPLNMVPRSTMVTWNEVMLVLESYG
jgi:hypothetical protein